MYKDLMLNKDSIENAIMSFCKSNYSEYDVSNDKIGEYGIRYKIKFDGNEMFLDIYHNKKGGTTLQVTNGKFTEEKKKLADFISINCKMSSNSSHNRDILFENIESEDFEKTLEIIEEEEILKNVLENKNEEKRKIVKLEGCWSDKVTLIYTYNTKTVRIQGRPLILFNLCCSYFNEQMDVDNIVNYLEKNYQSNISKTKIEDQFIKYLPKSHDKHSEKLKKSLIKAVYNLNMNQQEYTCTELVFEVLRALEGHIKLTLVRDFGIKSNNKYGSLSMFSFDHVNGIVTLQNKYENIINNSEKVKYYKEAYKHYVVFRHKIFHWDFPDDIDNDNTQQIDDIEDAKNIIIETLKIIDNYYYY